MEQSRYEQVEQAKETVRKMNVEAVAALLIKIQQENHELKSDMIELKRLLTNVRQETQRLDSKLNAYISQGRIQLGTGPTVRS